MHGKPSLLLDKILWSQLQLLVDPIVSILPSAVTPLGHQQGSARAGPLAPRRTRGFEAMVL